MSETHEFQPLHHRDSVTAGCSCGWTSAYAHAFVKYAAEDHEFHVEEAHRVGVGS